MKEVNRSVLVWLILSSVVDIAFIGYIMTLESSQGALQTGPVISPSEYVFVLLLAGVVLVASGTGLILIQVVRNGKISIDNIVTGAWQILLGSINILFCMLWSLLWRPEFDYSSAAYSSAAYTTSGEATTAYLLSLFALILVLALLVLWYRRSAAEAKYTET